MFVSYLFLYKFFSTILVIIPYYVQVLTLIGFEIVLDAF